MSDSSTKPKVGGGEMEQRIRAFDWSKTPLGPADAWSPALRMMVAFLLANRFPLLAWWGPQFVSIYNDAYRPVLGTKHPSALGQPVSECWKEIWHVLKPLIDDLSDVSRIEQGKIALHRQRFDFCSVIQLAAHECKSEILK